MRFKSQNTLFEVKGIFVKLFHLCLLFSFPSLLFHFLSHSHAAIAFCVPACLPACPSVIPSVLFIPAAFFQHFLLCFFCIMSLSLHSVGSHNFRNVHARGHCPHVNSAALAHCLRFEALTVNSFHKSCTVDIIIRGCFSSSWSGACAALVSRLTQLSLSAALSANCQFSI